MFPSVPRLYNKFYTVMNETLNDLSGCKGWLARSALSSKISTVQRTGQMTSGCWDCLVFKKLKLILGGNVKYMITASAPIDPNVLEFLKCAFCCPVIEGYGLTETSGGSSFTSLYDPVIGHVGGPTRAVKWRFMDIPEM